MPDPRLDAIANLVERVEGAACRLARIATRAALAGALAGAVLWWSTAGERVTEWWEGTAVSVLVLLLCVAPALWLYNARTALLDLVELPDRLGGVATKRAGRLRARTPPPPPKGGLLATVRAVRGVVRDYGDVVGSWGTVAQLLAPSFWFLTLGALAAVPVVALLAVIAALVDAAI